MMISYIGDITQDFITEFDWHSGKEYIIFQGSKKQCEKELVRLKKKGYKSVYFNDFKMHEESGTADHERINDEICN